MNYLLDQRTGKIISINCEPHDTLKDIASRTHMTVDEFCAKINVIVDEDINGKKIFQWDEDGRGMN